MEKVGWGSDGYSAETAKGIRAERIRAIWHGEELPREKTKVPHFEEAAKLFLGWAENNKTDRNDQSRYENHLREAFKKKRLNEISPFDLEMIKSKFSRKISPPLPFATFFSL